MNINSLIDTGSSITVMHPSKFYEIDKAVRPTLSKNFVNDLEMANGELMAPEGCVTLPITLDGQVVEQRVIIADLKAHMILGHDFLKFHNCQLNLGEGTLTFRGKELKCNTQTDKGSVFKIAVQELVCIPPRCEMIIEGKVDQSLNDKNLLIEGTKSELQQSGLLVARCLVKPQDSIVPLRVMNLGNETLHIHKGTSATVAELEPNIINESNEFASLPERDTNFASYMKPLWETCTKNLTPDQQIEAAALLHKHLDVFARSKADMGRTDIVLHKVETGNARPIKQQPRRVPLHKRDAAISEVQKMLESGVIEPSSSPWSSPVVLVTKKDGSIRYCIDYRKLNAVTQKDSYPLPRIVDSLDALRGSKWFSCLDLASGYWQVMMDPKDKEKTAFVTPQGFYQFRVMPFGLCNAAATFERLMENVLAGLNFEICLLYIDDVIVYSKDFNDHLSHLDSVLQRLKNAGLKVSAKKCNFFQDKVTFLGHIVSQDGISTSPDKIAAVKDWPTPKTVTDVRSFLGTCSYYRRFIKHFADIARPLHKLTEKGDTFKWTAQCDEAFQQLKSALTSAPILRYPDLDLPFVLDTDASAFAMGAVLSQVEDGVERPVAYFSKTFNKPERNYCVTRRELLAIVSAVKHFHHYLYGTHFLIRTDHGALTWLLNFKNPEGQVARWIEVLQTYDFKIEHRPGKQHGNSDGLSRRPCSPCNHCDKKELNDQTTNTKSKVMKINGHSTNDDVTRSWYEAKTNDELRQSQETDQTLRKIRQWKIEERRPEWQEVAKESTEVKAYWAQWDRLQIKEGVMYRTWEEDDRTTHQLIVPKSMKEEVLQLIHDNPTGGHLGITKTNERLKKRFYWISCKDDVTRYIQQCNICEARKNPPRAAKGKLGQYLVGAPMERVAIDILGPLPRTEKGNKYIVIISDYFTRWVEAYPVVNQEAETVAKVFTEEFIARYGVPLQVHTGQGRQFESTLLQDLCKYLKIEKTRTTAFNPKSDGLVERFNRTIEDMIGKYIRPDQKDWDDVLPLLMLAYRSSEHDTTGYSPARLFFGRELNLPIDVVFGKSPETIETYHKFVNKLKESIETVHDKARAKMIVTNENQKRRYDVRANQIQYSQGQHVWIADKSRSKGRNPKLQFKWKGPYIVLGAISDLVYKVRRSKAEKPLFVHHDRMKLYRAEVPDATNV